MGQYINLICSLVKDIEGNVYKKIFYKIYIILIVILLILVVMRPQKFLYW